MNNNSLGIIGIVAGSIVALGGIAIALEHRAQVNLISSSSTSGDSYGIIFQLDGDPPPQWKDIQKVLNATGVYKDAHRDELYRIRPFKGGVAGKDLGKLPIDQLLFENQKIPDNFTGYTIQVGVGGKDSYQKVPPNMAIMPQGRGRVNMRESRLMVEAINDILESEQ
jgi:hypothetical protein